MKNKLLHVTTFGRADVALLVNRFKFQQALCGKLDRKLILLASADVHESQIADPFNAAKECYSDVDMGRIKAVPQRQDWPYGVNHAFQYTVRTLMGEMQYKPNVRDWRAFLYYECDMTPLAPTWADTLDAAYFSENKPFAGYIHQTTMKPTNRKVTHMNGGGCYPLDMRFFTPQIMLAERLPWDVNGLSDAKLGQITHLNHIYAHYYGTHTYRKEGDQITALRGGGKDCTKLEIDLAGKVIHHGCKDQSLMKILTPAGGDGVQGDPATGADGGSSFSPSVNPLKSLRSGSPSWEELARQDKANGMKWRDLLKKYGKMPAQMKAALENAAGEPQPTCDFRKP